MNYQSHPFYNIPENANYEIILENFLGMSQAFPYLQAGSQGNIAFSYIEKNENIPREVELTSVVGNFLCWDETGAFYRTLSGGLSSLPSILNTEYFHANLLKRDCYKLLGKEISPYYSEITKKYLQNLYKGLSAGSHITRVAYMVSFEMHAEVMIKALWDSVANNFSYPKEKLSYFRLHVGEYDPKEIYHIQMTNQLISEIITDHDKEIFNTFKEEAIQLNINWCKDVVNSAIQ